MCRRRRFLLLILQKFGSHNLYRVVVDGDFVLDSTHGKGSIKGDDVLGAIYLPSDTCWRSRSLADPDKEKTAPM